MCEAAVSAAERQLENLTRTTGFVMNNGQFSLFTDAYRQSLSLAELEVASGVTDYNTAIRNVMKPYTVKGITTVGFESGRVWSLEASVRQCVLQGVKDIAKDITEQTAKDLKTDGWEITAHVDCAPDHQDYQGKQYSNKEYKELNARLARPIGVFNCRHTAYPILLGISEPAYSDKELAEMKAKNKEGIEYEGKRYTLYEADQMQRKFERNIRKVKRELIAADETNDKEMFTAKSIKLRRLREAYKDFSGRAGLDYTHKKRHKTKSYLGLFKPKFVFTR